ncbi:MAG: helix-turn-helix domain-containing protein [Actinomycetales bacterium]|nr:helix-turn-helix domain-containing protein [Actinomycetales bacterium]
MAEATFVGAAEDPPDGGAVDNLGARLRDVRLQAGLSLREVARRLGVSPSFISQMENGKSQPSVATLYSMAQLLDVSIDELFQRGAPAPAGDVVDPLHAIAVPPATIGTVNGVISRSDFSSPAEAWAKEGTSERVQVVTPAERPRLVMDSGVVWEQLASNNDRNLDFMEITYPAGTSSTNDGRMLRHHGMEYGYLLSGTLQITHGFETYLLHPGESMCLDPSIPHLLTNPGTVPARGIWVVHHCMPGHS